MEILKGMVRDQGYPDTECTYGKVDDKTLYYFIPDGKLANENIIVSTNLKEAIGHAKHTSLGLIDPNGNLLIPCEHKCLKQVGNKEDNLLLAEKNIPTTDSVIAFLKNKDNPANQQSLEESDKLIKDQIIQAMGMSGDFIFSSPGSEAALYTMDGVNVSNGYYSYIAELNSNYYFSTNVPKSQILTFNSDMLKQQVNEETVETEQQTTMPNIDIPISQQIQNESEENIENNTISGVVTPPQVEPENIEQNNSEQQEETTVQVNQTEEESVASVSQQEINVGNEKVTDGVSSEEVTDEDNNELTEEQDSEEVTDEENDELTEEQDSEEVTDEENDELTEEQDSEEITDEDNDELTEEQDSEEITDEDNNELSDEVDNEEVTNEDSEEKLEENQSNVNYQKNRNGITDEDVATPGIQNATQTIRNLLEINREQRLELDRKTGEIDILKSNVEILREDNESKEAEIVSLRQEASTYRTQAIETNRENIRLKAALERQDKIVESLEERNNGLSSQLAGLHTLNNAVIEANALVQPIEQQSKSYKDGSLDVYGDYNYLGNGKSKGKAA